MISKLEKINLIREKVVIKRGTTEKSAAAAGVLSGCGYGAINRTHLTDQMRPLRIYSLRRTLKRMVYQVPMRTVKQRNGILRINKPIVIRYKKFY